MSVSTLRKFEKVCQILDGHGRSPAKLVPILQEIQAEYRYLPEQVLSYVATALAIPPARVFGVATFYAHFALKPKGKYVVHVCDGTACHVKDADGLLAAIRARLGLAKGQDTTEDLRFTVETVSCLGACGLAPVMVVNERIYGQMTPERCVQALEEIMEREAR